jgi:hypothetical protein
MLLGGAILGTVVFLPPAVARNGDVWALTVGAGTSYYQITADGALWIEETSPDWGTLLRVSFG